MGNFYNPHIPAQQGPVNSTPPIPHRLPITGGDQPPRFAMAATMMMVAVLASWPADLEPRLHHRNVTPVKIAPLTLTYGQQPPIQSFLSPVDLQILRTAWPSDAPLPPRGASSSWMASVVDVVPYARPRYDIYAANQDLYKVSLVSSFVVAADNPDQPPRQSALSRASQAIIGQAWQPDPITPQAEPSAAWNVTITGYVPPPDPAWQVWTANQPPDPQPVQRLRSIVPTFPAVSQPPVQAGLSVTELVQINATWQEAWGAQTYADNAAWNIPSVAILAYTPLPKHIWTAWEPPPPLPVRPVQIAPLTLVYGSQPVPRAPLSVQATNHIVSTWQQTWDTQTAPDSAGWNVPPASAPPHVPLPQVLWTSWEPPFVAPPKPVSIAPLTLVYGQQPQRSAPIRPANQVAIWASWPPEKWSAQAYAPSTIFMAPTNPPPIADATVVVRPVIETVWIRPDAEGTVI